MTEAAGATFDAHGLLDGELDRRRTFDREWGEMVRDSFVALCGLVVETVRGGGTIFLCGNGGSAAQAQHFAAELVGRFRKERRPTPAIALTVDTSALTAIGNDYGFEEVFRRQAEALMRPGDLLLGLSTSGDSPNVVEALAWATANGFATAAMTGEGGGKMGEVAGCCVAVPSTATDLIQERHLTMLHILAEAAERVLSDES